jgi:hypothetical protein
MKILLQQKESGLYFCDIGSWNPDPSEAMDFLSSTSAIDFCVANKISDVHIVLPVLIRPNEPPESRRFA